MTKHERIIKAIEADKHLIKALDKMDWDTNEFIKQAQRYIKAVKQRRLMCIIGRVSQSGMSRTMKFLEFGTYKGKGHVYQFWAFFKVTGHTEARNNRDYFSIGGCGMDMVFHTNYVMIHKLHSLGFISKAQCERLAQETPRVIS